MVGRTKYNVVLIAKKETGVELTRVYLMGFLTSLRAIKHNSIISSITKHLRL